MNDDVYDHTHRGSTGFGARSLDAFRRDASHLGVLLRAAVLASVATASATAAQDLDLRLFDSFCCEAGGTVVDAHPPELDEAGDGWRVEPSGAPAPQLFAGSLYLDASGTGAGTASQAAVTDGPSTAGPDGERTLHVRFHRPTVPTADTTRLVVYARYVSPADYVSVEVSYWPGFISTFFRVYAVAGGVRTLVRSWNYTPGHRARDVELTVHDDGAALTVHHDGTSWGTHATAAHAGAPGLGLAGTGTSPLRVLHLAVSTPSVPAAAVCPTLRGYQAQSCVRSGSTPLRTGTYDEARDHLFAWVWTSARTNARFDVEALYSGATVSVEGADTRSPREQAQDGGLNTEHVWPRSRGAQQGTSTQGDAHNDLHHLAPALGSVNTARSNRPFGDDFFRATETRTWYRGTTARPASEGLPPDPETWSRVEDDFTREPDDGDGFVSVAEQGRFDVRHDRRGDAARQAAYFLTLYRIEAEDGDEGPAFIDETMNVLLAWHLADPVDADERERDRRIHVAQGNANPYVWDATLLERALYSGADQPRSRDVWINEIHHSNTGADAGEGVEVAGPAGTDLYGWRIWAYSGYGDPYTAGGMSGGSVALTEVVDDEGGTPAIGAVWVPLTRLRGGCQGLALVDPDGALVQFLSYGGCRFNALSGPVFDLAASAGAFDPAHADSLVWSDGIAGPGGRTVQEWSALPVGLSLQLTGAGQAYEDFAWGGPHVATPGRLGDYQAGFGGSNLVSGWAGGAVPLGLVRPPDGTEPDEDRPDDTARTPASGTPTADALTVGHPSPNPTRGTARIGVEAPPGSRVSAEVFDALGRLVARQGDVAGDLMIDASPLPPGPYVVRISAAGHTLATRTLTVVR